MIQPTECSVCGCDRFGFEPYLLTCDNCGTAYRSDSGFRRTVIHTDGFRELRDIMTEAASDLAQAGLPQLVDVYHTAHRQAEKYDNQVKRSE